MNIVDPILFQCKYHPPAVAMGAPGTAFNIVSYARLEQWIHNVTKTGLFLGLSAGQTVAILVKDNIFHALLILGLTRLGVVTLSARYQQLPKELRVDAVITDAAYPFTGVSRIIPADTSWLNGDGKPPDPKLVFNAAGHETCRLILTSGTSGEAKVVAVTHDMLFRRIARHHVVFGNRLPNCSRTYCDVGLATSLGWQFLIYMLWRGGTIFFGGDTPEATLQGFDLYKVQNVVASPHGLAEFVKFYEAHDPFQSAFEMVLSVGSMLQRPLADRVRRRMCVNLISAYGSTEASMTATAPAHAIKDVPGAVGYVTPDVTVEIVDAAGNVLNPGQEGIVRVRGPYSVDAYFGDVEKSQMAFRDGWFYPGDTGRITPERLLVIAGRDAEVLNLGGDKIKPELVEEALTAFAGVEQAAAFSITRDDGTEQLCALIVAGPAYDEVALKLHCEKSLARSLWPTRFIAAKELPRNDMGKVDRHRLPEFAKNHRP